MIYHMMERETYEKTSAWIPYLLWRTTCSHKGLICEYTWCIWRTVIRACASYNDISKKQYDILHGSMSLLWACCSHPMTSVAYLLPIVWHYCPDKPPSMATLNLVTTAVINQDLQDCLDQTHRNINTTQSMSGYPNPLVLGMVYLQMYV